MENKVKISISVTEETSKLLEKMGDRLVNGVRLSRGDVVDYLAAEKAKAMGLGRGPLMDALVGDEPAEWVKGETE